MTLRNMTQKSQPEGLTMSRKEALQIGKTIADRWYQRNESTILAKQNIERRKAWEQKKPTTPASK